jgi:hypothetical protein
VKPPLQIKYPDTAPLAGPLHYVVAGNGVFQVRRGRGYRAVTRVASVPGLLPEQERLEYDFPRLPALLLDPVLAFFSEVWRVHRGEAIALLFWDGRSQFRAIVPRQRISGWEQSGGRWVALHGVRYAIPERPEGFVRFGSIHSHGDLPAYASQVDEQDERAQGDGLHVVLGDVDRPVPSRSAAFVAGGVRFPLPPEDVLEPIRTRDCPAPAEWMAQIVDSIGTGGTSGSGQP